MVFSYREKERSVEKDLRGHQLTESFHVQIQVLARKPVVTSDFTSHPILLSNALLEVQKVL